MNIDLSGMVKTILWLFIFAFSLIAGQIGSWLISPFYGWLGCSCTGMVLGGLLLRKVTK